MNGEQFRTKANIAVQQVDLGRMLKATNLIGGAGLIERACSAGDHRKSSMATMLANGNRRCRHGATFTMAGGGELSALLVGLVRAMQFGNARCCRPLASRFVTGSNVSLRILRS